MFSTEIFMPRGHSYLWTPWLIWSELGTNWAIALGCLAISVTLFLAARRAGAGPRRRVSAVAGLLAVTLAATHFIDGWTIWAPIYGVDVVVRTAAAAAAIATALILPRLLRAGRSP